MTTRLIGPGLVLAFAFSQAFRDVFFAGVFQGIDLFAIVLLAFSISALLFGGVTLVRDPAAFTAMHRELRTVFWMNVTTALAWTCYFFSLKHLQPSIVNTLHSGMGPLTVIALAGLGAHITKPSPVRRAEYVCYAGLALSLAVLWWVVLTGRSGLPTEGAVSLLGLTLLIASGASITISLLLSKRLNERGIGADAVSAGRYVLIILVALLAITLGERQSGISDAGEFAFLAAAATILIVLPLYSLQVGISRTAPLTAQVIRSLGPVFVFALELADGRISYSGPALFGIALYSVFSIASNVAHGWHDRAPEAAGGGPIASRGSIV